MTTSPTSSVKQPDNELLSDEGLTDRLTHLMGLCVGKHDNCPYQEIVQRVKGDDLSTLEAEPLIDFEILGEITKLIQSQKQLHANMVIGEDPSYCYPDSITWGDTEHSHNAVQYGRDELRNEQRQRNSNHA